jgi:hypothetical protein
LTAGTARYEAFAMRWASPVLIALASLAPLRAVAGDRPVGGKLLRLSAASGNPAARSLIFRATPDPSIAAPFGDPTTAASLFVFSSNQSGGCRLDVTLPAANWAMFEEIVLDLARKAGGLARTTRL